VTRQRTLLKALEASSQSGAPRTGGDAQASLKGSIFHFAPCRIGDGSVGRAGDRRPGLSSAQQNWKLAFIAMAILGGSPLILLFFAVVC
jgi:hypothetical protein